MPHQKSRSARRFMKTAPGACDWEQCLLMGSNEPVRARANASSSTKQRKPRQEISACLKWLVFLLNSFVFLVGVVILALGIYLFIKDFREVKLVDVILNPAILISIFGLSICIVSFLGSMGALRDNIFLLKCFALCVFFSYILVVITTFILFILFYTDTTEGLSAHSLLLYAIKNYHTNRNLAEIMDALQENLECCGVSSIAQGYRDWSMSYQFNCTPSNPQPEKCGVPFSCCRKSVISEAAGSSNPLLPAMRSLECWQNALTKRPAELEHDIYTRGCFQPLRTLFESHAVHIGAVVALLIIPVCISVCLTNILAKQVDHQRYLLEREVRRNERRKKRDRDYRIREQMNSLDLLEEGHLNSSNTTRPKPPDIPPPLPPCDAPRKKSRATSSSPTRKPKPTGVNTENANRPKRTPPSANRASPPVAIPVGHPVPHQPSSTNNRTQQWVLQQSDLVPQKTKS